MVGYQFDAFAKELARGFSRRRVLGAIGMGAAALLGHGATAAALPPPDHCQEKPGGPCTQVIPCCNGACNDGGTCGCAAPEVECNEFCKNPKSFASDPFDCGACGTACGPERACCDGVCVSLQHDQNNCKYCGRHCPNGWICDHGTCADPTEPVPCYDACGDLVYVSLQSNANHCGACGHACPEDWICDEGVCRRPNVLIEDAPTDCYEVEEHP